MNANLQIWFKEVSYEQLSLPPYGMKVIRIHIVHRNRKFGPWVVPLTLKSVGQNTLFLTLGGFKYQSLENHTCN
jgi:hypothetical protein